MKSNSRLAWFLLIILSLIWGSSFILIKKALLAFSPLQVGSARIVISFLAFLPLFIYQFKSINWSKLWGFLVVGICGSGIPAFLYAIGQTHVSSGVAGVLNSLTPIFSFLLAFLFFKQKYSIYQMLGISCGFIGIILIFLGGQNSGAHFEYAYAALIVIATIFYAISANTVNKFLKSEPPIVISTISFMLVGPFVMIYLLSTDVFELIQHHPEGWTSLWALIILSLVGTFGANILFFKLIQITDAIFSTSVAFLIPFVALFWGFWDGESIGLLHLVSLIIILFGIFLIKYSKKPR